jgi:hypothetical protein
MTKKFPLRILLFTCYLLLAISLSCERNTTPFTLTPAQLTLNAEYVAVTEAWLQVQTENISRSHRLKVWRDKTIVFNGLLETTDTTIYDSTLLPAHYYTYQATIIKNGNNLLESQPLRISTMDTTSHDFTWEVFTFGTGGSSILWDVAIISPDNIWAVGQIYADSTQPWLLYNAVHWDGQQWELKRIKTLACGGADYPPIQAIFSFAADDILFAHIDGSISHYDGIGFANDCSLITQLNGSVNKMWGVAKNDLFVVSGNGFIAHYNGSSWQKIESGTDLPINDIWGAKDDETGEDYILCPASYKFQLDEKKLLRINPDLSVQEENWPFQDRRVHSVWFKNEYHIFICGAGVFLRNRTGQYNEFNEIPLIFTERIRGNDINDLFVAGDFGILAHYNGLNWKVYPDAAFGLYRSLDYKGDIAVASGEEAGQAVILMVKR